MSGLCLQNVCTGERTVDCLFRLCVLVKKVCVGGGGGGWGVVKWTKSFGEWTVFRMCVLVKGGGGVL